MKDKQVHFVGIGGIGMSGLARLFKHAGPVVTGSDAHETNLTRTLEAEGVEISYRQSPENISSRPGLELVVYTEAMAKDHPELVAAREQGIRTINYFEALGEVANQYYLIAVAGTHGKTTTTAMLTDILEEASYDPTAIVGSLRSKTGKNFRAGKSKYFIAEACEYRRDFLHLSPTMLVITNIEHEHVDYYKDVTDVQSAFRELALRVPDDGFVVCDTSDAAVIPVLAGVKAQVVDYRKFVDPMTKLHLPGIHNRLNAAAAGAAAATLGVEKRFITDALENFAGTWRRFEYKGDIHGAKVYDDYSHHPTEIRAAISGARELYPQRRLTVVFQPHTYSRTKELFADFVDSLAQADEVILVPIYGAREQQDADVSSERILDKLTEMGSDAYFFHTLEAATEAVKERANAESVIIVMGAGTISSVATALTQR